MYKLNDIKLSVEELNRSNYSEEHINMINKIKKTGKLDHIDRNIINEFVEQINVHENRNI